MDSRRALIPSVPLLTLVLALSGCGPDIAVDLDGQAGERAQPIVNGALDSDHDAVVAVVGDASLCSGTIIHVGNGEGIVLTAAHCLELTPTAVVLGDDINAGESFTITEQQTHPSWDGAFGFDFALLRIAGATASTPFIPVATDPDGLTAGTVVRHVGYGATSVNDGDNTQRRQVDAVVNDLGNTAFTVDATAGGPCSGDSGGPALSGTAPERVVGVASAGDPACAEATIDGRVAPVVADFIAPFINDVPPPPSCDTCFEDATSPPAPALAPSTPV